MTQRSETDTVPPSMDPLPPGQGIDAPTTFFGVLRRLGPGLIIAGSIVGSGELIATTKTGAQAGITLLWLIILGCLIKVFVQIELGRHTITWGETTLSSLNQVPGPRLGVNWILWFWLLMMAAGMAQLGGIVGGVGQAMAISFPVTGDYAHAIRLPSSAELSGYVEHQDRLLSPWELALRAQAKERAPLDDAFTDKRLSFEELDWIRTIADRATQRLEELEARDGSGAKIEEAADAWISAEKDLASARGSDASTVEASARRKEAADALNAILDEENVRTLRGATPSGESPTPVEERAMGRLVRGQRVLGYTLAEIDAEPGNAPGQRGDAPGFRAVHAVERVRALRQARDDLAQLAPPSHAPEASAEVPSPELASARERVQAAEDEVKSFFDPRTIDDKYWASLATIVTILLLVRGKYGIIELISTVLVVAFTFITIGNVFALQSTPQWSFSASDFLRGLSFGLPEVARGSPVTTALATFGIIGVGASELISYPYWCMEKGYAKFTGTRTEEESWARRARGWMRVMHCDAFLSMVIYTIATLAFYIMGAAVLFREGRDPEDMRMVGTLATAYVPVFGEYARWLFLIGAFAVLYSTFLVATAGHTRTLTDLLKVINILPKDDQRKHEITVRMWSILLPLASLALFCSGINPVTAILLAGTSQALLLPMIGFGALYFRYRKNDERLKPSPTWDFFLIVSFLGLLIAGAWGVATQAQKILGQFGG